MICSKQINEREEIIMPKRPVSATLTNSSVDVINAIRNSASINYQNYVPVATPDADSIREIGAIICDDPQLYNEFMGILATRIYKVIVTSKMYENPWTVFKKGIVEFGEKIEDIFIDLAKPHTYDPENAYANELKRELPNIHTAFYVMNYQKFYKVTTTQAELKTAFLALDGITNFITKAITSMYSAANYDEYQVMKYMLARTIIKGGLYPVTAGAISANDAKTVVSKVKQISNDLTFMKKTYNRVGVYNQTLKDNQYIIIDSTFDAIMDVEVLASAFNMDKVTFMGHRILVDGFGNVDGDRLGELFDGETTTYTAITDEQATALNAIPCVIVDENFFQIYDNLIETGEDYVKEGLYWNNWLHNWKTFAVSPFSNAIAFLPSAPVVSAVSVSPSTATMAADAKGQFTASVTMTGFGSNEVVWSVPTNAKASVDSRGVVTIAHDAVSASTITLTATSVQDGTVAGTATITIA